MPNNATVTINLNQAGAKIVESSTFSGGDINSLIQLQGNGSLNINHVPYDFSSPPNTYISATNVESAISTATNSTGILNIGTSGNANPRITGSVYGIKANEGTTTININRGNITGTNGSGIYQTAGKLSVGGNNVTINIKGQTSGVNMTGGELTYTGGTINATGTDDSSAALILAGKGVTATIAGTRNTTSIGANSTNALIIENANGDGTNQSTINITGGQIGNSNSGGNSSLINNDPYATVDISGGNFVKSLSGNYEVTGGTFSTILEPSKVKADYSLVLDGKTTIYADEATYNAAQNTIQCSIERGGLTYNFTSLAIAQNNIQVGETLKLEKDIALEGDVLALTFTKNFAFTLDLNGHKIENKNDGKEVATTTQKRDEITKELLYDENNNPIYQTMVYETKAIVVESSNGSKPDLTIIDSSEGKTGRIYSKKNYAITVWGDGTANSANLTLDGVTVVGSPGAVSGNASMKKNADGSVTSIYGGTNITVNGATLAGTAEDSIGIYHPQEGTLTINSGTVQGATGAEVRGGEINVNGGTVRAGKVTYDETSGALTFTAATEVTGTGTTSGGSTSKGVGIAITPYANKEAVKVNVSGSETKIAGAIALAVSDPATQSNVAAPTIIIDDGNITSTASNVAGATAISSNDLNANITVNKGTVTGNVINSGRGITEINGGTVSGNVTTTSGTTKVTGGTVTGNVTNSGEGTTEISGGTVSGDVTSTAGTTKVIGGTVTGSVTSTGGSTEVSGGEVRGTVGDNCIADGYIKGTDNIIRANAKWTSTDTANQYNYVLTGTKDTESPGSTVIAAVIYSGASSALRDNTEYRLLGIPDDAVTVATGEKFVTDSMFAAAKYNINDGTAAITPLTSGFKIIGKTFVDEATKLTTSDDDSLGIVIDATNNSLADIAGDAGDDSIKAGARVTTLNGGAGDDSLEGNSEGNTFIYSAGKDVISNYTYGTDTFSLTGSLTPPVDLDKTSFNGSNLVINFDDDNSLTFRSAADVALVKGKATYSYQGNTGGSMNYIALNSETEHGISLGAGYSGRFNGANAANEDYATIDASHVNNAIRVTGNDNNNYMVAGSLGGALEGGEGSDTLMAAESSAANLRFEGGAGSDSLVGGAGYNLFVYNEGSDSISGYHAGDLVTVRGGNIDIANAAFSAEGDNISLDFGGEDRLIFENISGVENGVSIKSGRNTYIYTKETIALENKTDKGITLTSGFSTDSFAAGTYDTINAVAVGKAISLIGNDNNNVIFGSSLGGNLYGGAGNDKLDISERANDAKFVLKYSQRHCGGRQVGNYRR